MNPWNPKKIAIALMIFIWAGANLYAGMVISSTVTKTAVKIMEVQN